MFVPMPSVLAIFELAHAAHLDVVLLGQLDDGRTLGVAVGNRAPLAFVESLWSTELGALALGPLDALLAALADQAALEFGNAAHDGQHQPADIGRGVAPRLAERYEATGERLQFVEDVVQVAAGARQTIQFGNVDHIAG
jgi:hypothetical protein